MNLKNVSYDEQDRLIEQMWEELEDIPFDEDKEGELFIAQDWKEFAKGDYREDIWLWFDKRHSKGVDYLLHEHIFSYDRD